MSSTGMDFPAPWPISVSKVTARQRGGKLDWVPEEADQFRSCRDVDQSSQIAVRRQKRSLKRQIGLDLCRVSPDLIPVRRQLDVIPEEADQSRSLKRQMRPEQTRSWCRGWSKADTL